MKRLKKHPKISLESIDDLTRVTRSIDSSETFLWLECLDSSTVENVKKNNLTRGLSPYEVDKYVKKDKELPLGKLPLGNVLCLCGREPIM
jgi:hypothetical protein